MVKLERAHGGCLGTRSRRRTGLTPICFGELYVSVDPEISEWGEPTIFSRIVSLREYIAWGRQTQGTETSKYLEEEKEKSIS